MELRISYFNFRSYAWGFIFSILFVGASWVELPMVLPGSITQAFAVRTVVRTPKGTTVRHTTRRTTHTVRVGDRVRVLPSGCKTVKRYGRTYHRCGSVYYRPYHHGNDIVYVVVNEP